MTAALGSGDDMRLVTTAHTATYKMDLKAFLEKLGIGVDHDNEKVTDVTLGRLGNTVMFSMTTKDIRAEV